MSTKDRQDMIKNINARFDSADNEAVVIEQLGSPTKLAITIARDYTPTVEEKENPSELGATVIGSFTENELESSEEKAPVIIPENTEDGQDKGPTFSSDTSFDKNIISGGEENLQSVPAEPVSITDENKEDEMPESKVRPAVLIFYIIISIIIGFPLAVVLISVGIPFIILGAGIIYGMIKVAISIISSLSIISDMLLITGCGTVIGAFGLLITWFGLSISFILGKVWIGKVLFGLGRRICYKRAVE